MGQKHIEPLRQADLLTSGSWRAPLGPEPLPVIVSWILEASIKLKVVLDLCFAGGNVKVCQPRQQAQQQARSEGKLARNAAGLFVKQAGVKPFEMNVAQLCVLPQLGVSLSHRGDGRWGGMVQFRMTLGFSHRGREPQVSERIKGTITANFVSAA